MVIWPFISIHMQKQNNSESVERRRWPISDCILLQKVIYAWWWECVFVRGLSWCLFAHSKSRGNNWWWCLPLFAVLLSIYLRQINLCSHLHYSCFLPFKWDLMNDLYSFRFVLDRTSFCYKTGVSDDLMLEEGFRCCKSEFETIWIKLMINKMK